MKKFLALLMLVALLVGCGGPTIDASSPKAFDESVQVVRESLDEEKRKEFDSAMRTILASQATLGNLLDGALSGGGEGMVNKVTASLDGMNAGQVIKKAEEIKKK